MTVSEFRVCGALVAPPTPYNAKGELCVTSIGLQAKAFKDSGIVGVYTTGTTGEGLSLTMQERKDMTAAWAKSSKEHGLVQIAHIGHTSVKEARELASHAEEVGAIAIAAVPPFYYKPKTVEALVDTLGQIASAAPKTPFYYYHIPSMTGVTLSMLDMLAHIEQSGKIPTFRGMKYTNTRIDEVFSLAKFSNSKYNILVGGDEMLVSAVAMGADGSIGIGYNIPCIGKIAADAYRMVKAGDYSQAMELQKKLVANRTIINKYPEGALKTAINMYGLNLGPERLPRMTLTDQQAMDLIAELKASGTHN